MNPLDPWERLRYRDVFPFTRPFSEDYDLPRLGYWLFAACAVAIAVTILAWGIDRFLKARGLR